MLKNAVVAPVCGLVVGGSLLAGIAVHALTAQAIEAPTAARPATAELQVAPPQVSRVDVPAVEVADDAAPPIDRADPRAYGFVVPAGGASYVQLSADDDDTKLAHGRVHFEQVDGTQIAYAAVAADQVPARLADWNGKRVIVDGTCEARVTGFAIVARLVGDPHYADGDGDHAVTWTRAVVMSQGQRILAARLDGCTGTWARDASLPPATVAVELPAPSRAVVDAARAQLLASPVGIAMDAQWALAGRTGDYRKSEELTVDAKLARNAQTAQTWLYVHAYVAGGCGGPDINLLGVYRIGADGTPEQVAATTTELQQIDQLIDVDGDGRFELRATDGALIGDPALLDARGQRLEVSAVPFFGCPC